MIRNILHYGDNLDRRRAFRVPPTNITLAQAQRVKEKGERGKGAGRL